MLTNAELKFLASQGLSEDDVFDARGHTTQRARELAKESGKTLLVGSPCRKAGHRLRTRSNHCAQCDSKQIAYQSRTALSSDVYVAVSPSLGWVKIGSSANITQRRYKLNFDAYGGANDWKLIFFVRTDEGGRLELAVHSALAQFAVSSEYVKDGKRQVSRECFQCSDLRAVNTLLECAKAGGHRIASDWRDRGHWGT